MEWSGTRAGTQGCAAVTCSSSALPASCYTPRVHLVPGTCILLAAVVAAPPALAQDRISLNFTGSGGRQVTAAAGVVAASGWNNVAGGSGSAIVLRDDAGADRGTRLAFTSASAGFRLNPPATSANGALFDGQVITSSTGGPATVTVSGIPFASYDVIAYVAHGPSNVGRDAVVTLGAGTFAFRNEDCSTYTDPVGFRLVNTTTVPGAIGNHVRFTGLTASSFSLVLQPAPSGNPGSSGLAGLQVVGAVLDADGDGLDDLWEQRWFGNLSQGPLGDPDADQLVNLQEQQRNTVPVDDDTDDDGLGDGAEVVRGTNPLVADTDGDSLRDGVETGTGTYVSPANTGTSPLLVDTDGDGARDGAEVRRGSNPCDPQSRPNLPNIVVILADDLGWGELGCYGQQIIRTPNLDALAAGGMRFTQFYSGSPVCAPHRSTLMTGRHTGTTQVRNNLATAALRPGTFTIGRMLQDEGYVTACVGKWGLGNTGSTGVPNQQGFDHFFGFLDQTHAHWYYPSYLWRNTAQVTYPGNNGAAGPTNAGTVHAHDEMTREALQFVDQNHQRPFFLYLAYTVPHVSLQEPAHSDPAQRALGRNSIDEFYGNVTWSEPNANFASSHYTSNARPRRAYAAMISAMDRDIGVLMARLAQYGIEDDTLVVFTADNGTSYCCGVDYGFFNSMGGLRGYKGEVYEGGIRVPTIARWPGRIPAGAVSDHVAASWDVLPTVAEVVDAAVPADLDGISFLPTLVGQPARQQQHEYLYWEYDQGGRRKAVRMGDWKGVRYGDAGAGAALQLYNLATDRNETTNVVAQQPAIAAQVDRIMAARHTFSGTFYRGLDEYPTVSGVTLANAAPGIQLDAAAVGFVQAPLVRDVTTELAVPFTVQLVNVAGRNANAGLLLGDGAGTAQAIRYEVDATAGRFRIAHGATLAEVPFGPGTSAFSAIDLVATYDVGTRVATLRDSNGILVATPLPAGPQRITHHGYRVDNARSIVVPIDPALGLLWRSDWAAFGSGCSSSSGVPLLRAVGPMRPDLGSTFTAEVSSFPPAATVAIGVLGTSNSAWNGSPLPLDLAPFGMPGCRQYVSADALGLLAATNGRAQWSLAIPAQGALLGLRFHQQALVLDPSANLAGLATSNAGSGVLGRP